MIIRLKNASPSYVNFALSLWKTSECLNFRFSVKKWGTHLIQTFFYDCLTTPIADSNFFWYCCLSIRPLTTWVFLSINDHGEDFPHLLVLPWTFYACHTHASLTLFDLELCSQLCHCNSFTNKKFYNYALRSGGVHLLLQYHEWYWRNSTLSPLPVYHLNIAEACGQSYQLLMFRNKNPTYIWSTLIFMQMSVFFFFTSVVYLYFFNAQSWVFISL